MSKGMVNKMHDSDIDLNALSMNWNEVISELAVMSETNRDTVEKMMEALQALLLREVVGRGVFDFPSVFRVRSELHNRKGDQLINVPNRVDEEGNPLVIQMPVTVRPKIYLSDTLVDRYIWARRNEVAKKNRISPEDWYKPYLVGGKDGAKE